METKKISVVEELVSEGRLKACETGIAERLQSLGFQNAAKIARSKPYPEIYEDRICEFLKKESVRRMMEIRDYKYPPSPCYVRNGEEYGFADFIECYIEGKYKKGKLEWREAVIEKYNAIPPDFVLAKLEEAKKTEAFDYFTVATLRFTVIPKPIEDPLLFGRIKSNRTRYFIAQWDNDLRLDDI